MGLVFAVQPDLRKSNPKQSLVLKSSKRRFSLGMGFVFGGALLGTMYQAAAPLFKLLWSEGTLFDQFITVFILGLITLYPLLAAACWFYEESIYIKKNPESETLFDIHAYESVFGFRWNKRGQNKVSLSQLSIENWKGAVNVASIDAKQHGYQNRYSTKGHWILKLKDERTPKGEITLERRAKREDLDLLLAQISAFFGLSSTQTPETNFENENLKQQMNERLEQIRLSKENSPKVPSAPSTAAVNTPDSH